MKRLVGAIALILAAPALAQAAPSESKMECCEKMKAEGKECCCKDMAKQGHDMKQDQQPKADGEAHKGHGDHAH